MSFIAGPYTWTYGTQSGPMGGTYTLGITEDTATLEYSGAGVDPIRGDNLGDVIQDGVFRGGNYYLELVLQEYNLPAARHCFHPWTGTFGEVGIVGSLLSAYADVIQATPLSPLSTLGTESTKILYIYKAVLAPGFSIRHLFGSRLRNVPVRFLLLPVLVGTSQRFFSLIQQT